MRARVLPVSDHYIHSLRPHFYILIEFFNKVVTQNGLFNHGSQMITATVLCTGAFKD